MAQSAIQEVKDLALKILHCTQISVSKSISILFYLFKSGIINSRNFTTKNIEFKKFYQREGEVLNNIETDQNSVVTIPTEPPSTKDPFDDFDDDDF